MIAYVARGDSKYKVGESAPQLALRYEKVQNLPKSKKYVNTLQLTDFQFMKLILLKFRTFHSNLGYMISNALLEINSVLP